MSILNLDDMPTDPVERIGWLGGVMDAAREELEAAFTEAYFEARLQGQLGAAISLRQHSRKRILAFTRKANEAKGRIVKRWPDLT